MRRTNRRTHEARRFERRHHAQERRAERKRERNSATGRRYDERHKHIGFNRLAARVAHEEESKGVPREEAQRIGKRTAGKVWWEQHKNTY